MEGLGQATPQGGRDAEEDAKASTRTKAAKYLKYGLQSYSQLLNGWKKIPALRGLAHAEVTAIAEANVALRNMKHARDREVTALVKRCFGVQRTKDVARVLSDFKKTGDSGVVLNPLVKVERTVRIAEAREWVGLSFEERRNDARQSGRSTMTGGFPTIRRPCRKRLFRRCAGSLPSWMNW